MDSLLIVVVDKLTYVYLCDHVDSHTLHNLYVLQEDARVVVDKQDILDLFSTSDLRMFCGTYVYTIDVSDLSASSKNK